jgi:predicted MFS family arabinose efflux permease
MSDTGKVKKVLLQLGVAHFIEALIAARAAKKRGKNPLLYFALTQVFGVFILVPLLRKPKCPVP